MTAVQDGDLLWTPTADIIEQANLTLYMRWLESNHGLHFDSYPELWQWSVDHIEAFWESLWSFFELHYSQSWEQVLVDHIMPGAQWFPGARLNYVENIFARIPRSGPVIRYATEDAPLVEVSREQLYDESARLAQVLRELGVEPGDRVAAYLPNMPEALIAFFATASLGAVWSSCSPDFGLRSILDRFGQIEPKVMIAVPGYSYGGRYHDRRETIHSLQAALPSLQQTILVGDNPLPDSILWSDAIATPTPELRFVQVPFNHPLWILYSSGTTGLPKPIVQGHGGILLEHAKATIFHNDLKPEDRFFWYSSTGWMMWNYTIGALLSGASIILYNGSPGYPSLNRMFELAEQTDMTYLGTSAAFIHACMKAGLQPNRHYDLSAIRAVGSTGSPLSTAGFAWVYDNLNAQLALESLSGGTDLCTAFVGGARIMPIHAGEIQGASLGAKVQAFDSDGHAVVNQMGELVITESMPSMPIYFWNDPDMARYKASYFGVYPGVWQHGDWIQFNEHGGCVIYGRSDSTINRRGIRMGTSELYRVVEASNEIADSLVVDLELLGRSSSMLLFVVLREGALLDEDLQSRIRQALRQGVSPHHLPDNIVAIPQVPYTLSGKKMEVPVRKILLGLEADSAANRGAMRNPDALDFFIAFANELNRHR